MERKSTIADSMILGQMQDHESYKKNVGIAEGLDMAHSIIDDVMKKLYNEEDD